MIVFNAMPVLLTAAVVFLVWRVVVWRRRGGDAIREVVVAMLFAWSLVVVSLTFFPLIIIFYDWYGSANFVPFASLFQLITETPGPVAFRNIVGNLVLFVPYGFLLPLLFPRLRSAGTLAWRAAVISVAIEVLQTFTRARAIDVDDVIINTLGALVGYGVFVAFSKLAGRSASATRIVDRVGARSTREPLLTGLVPIAVTILLVLPVMASNVVDATLGDRSGELVEDATSLWPGGEVVATADVGLYRFVAVGGNSAPSVIGLVEYQRVLPDRYTRNSWGDVPAGDNVYNYRVTAFNVTRDDLPAVVVWGSSDGAAATLRVTAPGYSEVFDLTTANPYFVVGFGYDVEAYLGPEDLVTFEFAFFDGDGVDVTDQYAISQG